MQGLLKRLEWVYQFLASKKLTLIIFLILGVIFIPRTFSEETDIRVGYLGNIFFGLLSLNMILCTVQRIKTLAKSVIIMHIGILVTFAGVVISSFGYIATVNVYEGSSVDTVYRWDLEKNAPLGVDLMLKNVNLEHYPNPVKVGVLRGEEKAGLFELKTGKSFKIDKYKIMVDSLDVAARNLQMSVYDGDTLIGFTQTDGKSDLPSDFPYEFKLVAYKDTALLKMWVYLELSRDSEIMSEGISAVNSPLKWEGINYHHVSVDYDEYGNRFAGIQITYDPGIKYVYTGFMILSIGCVMYAMRRFYAYRF